MMILKSVFAVGLAAVAALAISASAFAASTPAGPLTIKLTCDTGAGGSGTFKVTANSASSTATVKCGKSASVTNAAWQAGSKATIHQTAATASGQLKAKDVTVSLTAAGETVTIHNFKAASAAVATLAQTGGGVPALPIGLSLIGLLLVVAGARVRVQQR
ncbi:MAG TPA: hypothetical protein VNA31_07865 [bacterium]|nr:hypothetical protein [bacterium]